MFSSVNECNWLFCMIIKHFNLTKKLLSDSVRESLDASMEDESTLIGLHAYRVNHNHYHTHQPYACDVLLYRTGCWDMHFRGCQLKCQQAAAFAYNRGSSSSRPKWSTASQCSPYLVALYATERKRGRDDSISYLCPCNINGKWVICLILPWRTSRY